MFEVKILGGKPLNCILQTCHCVDGINWKSDGEIVYNIKHNRKQKCNTKINWCSQHPVPDEKKHMLLIKENTQRVMGNSEPK